MYDVLLYFFLNGLGFLFFLYLYNKFPKVRPDYIWKRLFPRPYDYTTIPGMKLDMEAENLPPLTIEPGQSLNNIADIKGHLEEIARYPNFRQFLEYCSLCYGPLSSFYWGPRYVVSVSSPKMVKELEKYKENLTTLCPITIGSALSGDTCVWETTLWSTYCKLGNTNTKIDPLMNEKRQNKICLKGPYKLLDNEEEKNVLDYIRQVPIVYEDELKTAKSIREVLSRPLIVSYNIEIDVDAHPIPKYVPIIIHVGGLVQRWDTEDIWEQYWNALHWIPGIEQLKNVEYALQRKINQEIKRRK